MKKNLEIENLYIIYKSLQEKDRAKIVKLISNKTIKINIKEIKEFKIRLKDEEIKVYNEKKKEFINRFSPVFEDNIYAEYVRSKHDSEDIFDLDNFYNYCNIVTPLYDLSNIELHMLKNRLDVVFRTFNAGNSGDDLIFRLKDWCYEYGYHENDLTYLRNRVNKNKLKPANISNLDNASKITLVSYFASGIGIGNYAKNFGKVVGEQYKFGCNDLYHKKNKFNQIQTDKISDINIFILGLDQFSNLDLKFNLKELKTKYNIAIPFWELESMSSEDTKSLEFFDEIWAPSDFILKSLSTNMGTSSKRKLKSVPVLFNVKKQLYHEIRTKKSKSLKYFIYISDLASGIDRKNLLGTILSFQKAFSKSSEEIYLYLKIYDSSDLFDYKSKIWQKVLKIISNDSRLIIIDKYLEEQQLDDLISNSMGLLSLHKSEGLGLNIIDAMQLGVPVICTGYGGNMSFCDSKNSLLVEFRMSTTKSSTDKIYSRQGMWAEPSTVSAAEKLKFVVYGDDQQIKSMCQRAKNNLISIQSKNSVTINKMLRRSIQRSNIKKLMDFLN